MAELDKTYRPDAVEAKQYQRWEDAGSFACDPTSGKTPYTIMMPPPNVTGSLHMGHALTFTIQDVLVRYHRMQGRDTLWQPGTDHAGIATQMVVERQLAEQGLTRHQLGRGKFLDKVWDWKAQSGGTIIKQLRHLGASADWPRERFTMDEGLSAAVRKVFVQLHQEGLIYKDKRLVNWDPKLHTAISDLEVLQTEINGHLWHFRYPVVGEEERYITVATTRPETMLGDSAVAVHPEDDRYQALVGKQVILPLVERPIPIVADDYADPETGSGAVKITPAHDFNDFEVGRRHDLARINVLDQDAKILDEEFIPAAYRGLDRYDARKKIVADMEARGLLAAVEDHAHSVPHGDRSGVAIEPWLTDQWYVNAEALAGPCIDAVEQGKTVFVPKQWENTFFDWMRNIQPWCISRQLWWGHQIPAWYGPDGEIFVAEDEAGAAAAALAHYGEARALVRDPDVLDTWFSSALWPFSTLGWPSNDPKTSQELAHYYPGNVLVTGFDIIFFWVARMMMMGIHFMGEVPFKHVYIHALVRDQHGQKMSKSKGNVIDPLELVEKYGCDALRFTLSALAVPGRDVKLDPARIEGYRNFATKLWNAARFSDMNGAEVAADFNPATVTQTLNKWVVGKMASLEKNLQASLDAYRLNDSASLLYQFTWNSFCDWYIEFAKPIFNGNDDAAIVETRRTTGWVINNLLRMLHPFMPFVTEELWGKFGGGDSGLLINARWPGLDSGLVDLAAEEEIDWLIRLISGVRGLRSETNVPAGAKVKLLALGPSEQTEGRLAANGDVIATMARLDALTIVSGELPKDAVQLVVDEATFGLPLGEVIDITAERARLGKEIAKLDGEITKINKKLGNAQFLAKAPVTVVAEQHSRRDDARQTIEKLQAALSRLVGL